MKIPVSAVRFRPRPPYPKARSRGLFIAHVTLVSQYEIKQGRRNPLVAPFAPIFYPLSFFIRIIQKQPQYPLRTFAIFNYKLRHASVYALENVPIDGKDGAVTPKSYMRWKPDDADFSR